jgi:transposase
MATKYVNVDRQTPMLLPPDVRDWVADNELAHFVLEAVEASDLRAARVNARGTGDAQYPPGLMLALLIYNYATGTFSSRAMERATYDSMAVRYLCANHHPDHDTIAKFRRENGDLLRAAFVRVLELAREVGLLKLGTVSVDGTKLGANAAKRRSLRRAELQAELARLESEVDALVAQAEAADQDERDDGRRLPQELAHRQRRLERLRTAAAVLAEREKAAAQARGQDRDKPPSANASDPDSAILPTAQGPFIQGYNAQAAVTATGPTLIVGAHVVAAPHDRQQLQPTLETIPAPLGAPAAVVADTGYDHPDQIEVLRQRGIAVYCHPQGLRPEPPQQRNRRAGWIVRWQRQAELDQPAVQKLYRRRCATSEPTFHIIKRLLGFTRFSLRGLPQVNLEWTLVCLAFNCRKLAARRA